MNARAPLSDAELRRFGLETGIALALLFGLILPLFHHRWLLWPWIAGAVLSVTALLWPRGLSPLQRVWYKLGHALGWINSRIVLSLLFYAVLTPIGTVARLRGRDPLRRKYDPAALSYCEPVQPRDPRHMERPF